MHAAPSAASAPHRSRPSLASELLSNRDVAQRFDVSGETLRRWREAGTGPRFIRLNGQIRYRRSDLEAFEAERTFIRSGDELAAWPGNGSSSRAGAPNARP